MAEVPPSTRKYEFVLELVSEDGTKFTINFTNANVPNRIVELLQSGNNNLQSFSVKVNRIK